MTESVTCYAGSRHPQRPVAFHHAGKELAVAAVEREWREPDRLVFIVQASDGRRYQLNYALAAGEWTIQPK